jgi:hypothetical protein
VSEREWAVVLPLGPLRVGEVIVRSDWPLHVTLVSNVRTSAPLEQVVAAFERLAVETSPQQVVVTDEAWFGADGTVLVDLVEGPSLLAAHRHALGVLEQQVAAVPVQPAAQRDGYRPHVTVSSAGRALRGSVLTLGTIALAEIEPVGGPGTAIPRVVLDLAAPAPEPVAR